LGDITIKSGELMIAVLLITALFIFISIYFFFRAEKLQRSLALLKRETANTVKENQTLSKSMMQIAANTEKFTKKRLQNLLNKPLKQEVLDELTLIKPFIDNHALIFKECLMKKGRLQSITRQCLSHQEGDLYKDFFDKIIKKDSKIQRLWNSNNFIGFISLTEALLVKYEEQVEDSDVNKENTSTEKLC